MDWLTREVATGIQRLLCLSLDGCPAAEVLPGTVAAWCEAIQRNRLLDEERDVPRIREAFAVLLTRYRRWPAPVDLIENLPRWMPEEFVALPVGQEEQARRDAVAKANLAKLKAMLDGVL
jgi:hypothetical protein